MQANAAQSENTIATDTLTGPQEQSIRAPECGSVAAFSYLLVCHLHLPIENEPKSKIKYLALEYFPLVLAVIALAPDSV